MGKGQAKTAEARAMRKSVITVLAHLYERQMAGEWWWDGVIEATASLIRDPVRYAIARRADAYAAMPKGKPHG